MSSKGPAEPFKKLLPQSWLGWFTAIVLGVVVVTNPAEAWHTTSAVVWGAGRWVGYQAFATCDTPPPYTWMAAKHCPSVTPDGPVPATQADTAGTGAAPPLGNAQAPVDRAVVEVVHLHRLVDKTLTDDHAKPGQVNHKAGKP